MCVLKKIYLNQFQALICRFFTNRVLITLFFYLLKSRPTDRRVAPTSTVCTMRRCFTHSIVSPRSPYVTAKWLTSQRRFIRKCGDVIMAFYLKEWWCHNVVLYVSEVVCNCFGGSYAGLNRIIVCFWCGQKSRTKIQFEHPLRLRFITKYTCI